MKTPTWPGRRLRAKRRLDANAQEVEDLVLGVARGRISKAEAAVFVQ